MDKLSEITIYCHSANTKPILNVLSAGLKENAPLSISMKQTRQYREIYETQLSDVSGPITLYFQFTADTAEDNQIVQNQQLAQINQEFIEVSQKFCIEKQSGKYLFFENELIPLVQPNNSSGNTELLCCTDLDDTLLCHTDRTYQDSFKRFYLKHFILREHVKLVYNTGRAFKDYLSKKNKQQNNLISSIL